MTLPAPPGGWDFDEMQEGAEPLVSIIVPCYNHAPYLRKRLDSVYGQTWERTEVILLDDLSTDGSREILDEYAQRFPEKTVYVPGNSHQGRAFLQWERGLDLAHGELVWIAESDDWCEPDFLEKMAGCFSRRSVMLAFCRSVFYEDGKAVQTTDDYLSCTAGGNWDRSFTKTAYTLSREGFCLQNLIVNASSAVFRHPGKLPEEALELCRHLRLCADWVFYLTVMRGGCVSYVTDTTNYYRIHPASTSLKVQGTLQYYQEYEKAMCYAARLYPVSQETVKLAEKRLKDHYLLFHPDVNPRQSVHIPFDADKVMQCAKRRLPTVVVSCFSLQPGGGEVYAIYLANALHALGVPVSLLNLSMENTVPQIERKISGALPVITVRNMDHMYQILQQLGAQIVHSHHASSDEGLAKWIRDSGLKTRLVITLHGMYELMPEQIFRQTFRTVDPVCSRYLYLTEKNLLPFRRMDEYVPDKYIRMENGVPLDDTATLSRSSLGIGKHDFVVATASRGIPEKGWEEAIQAVRLVRGSLKRPVHLIIMGDGEMRRKLEPDAPAWVHFLGVTTHVQACFAMCDAGLLASRFPGESYPLSVAECLLRNRPVIATDIGEVKDMLLDASGRAAGILLHLKNGKLDVQELARAVRSLAADRKYYERLKTRCRSAAAKFDMKRIAAAHLELYRSCLEERTDEKEKKARPGNNDLLSGFSHAAETAAAGVSGL